MIFNNLEELMVYQRARILSNEIWNLVYEWKDFFDKDTIGKQLVRAAHSVDANIAEGYGRYDYKENKNFCYYSRGSLLETKGFVRKHKSRNLFSTEQREYFKGTR